jgi:hypothetical protein
MFAEGTVRPDIYLVLTQCRREIISTALFSQGKKVLIGCRRVKMFD